MHGGRLPHADGPRHTPASSRWPEEPPYYHGHTDGGYSASGYLPQQPEKLLPDTLDGTEAETAMVPGAKAQHQAAGEADEPAIAAGPANAAEVAVGR
jgi:hypothetical protein